MMTFNGHRFDRDLTIQARVGGFIHDTLSTFTEYVADQKTVNIFWDVGICHGQFL